jgi:hypothetical protein
VVTMMQCIYKLIIGCGIALALISSKDVIWFSFNLSGLARLRKKFKYFIQQKWVVRLELIRLETKYAFTN